MQNNKNQKEIIKKDLIEFITKQFSHKTSSVNESTKLFEEGIVDSLGVIKLCGHIEKHYGIDLDPFDITVNNFDSIEMILNIILKKDK